MSETGSGRTKVVAGPFDNRDTARSVEQNIQSHLDTKGSDEEHLLIDGVELPDWAKGVRVEKIQDEEGAGDNWAVVATEDAR